MLVLFSGLLQPGPMARPPCIPLWLPLDQTGTYFITICVGGRRPVLNNPEIFGAILKICDLQEQWETVAAVVMPDHLHALVSCERAVTRRSRNTRLG
jgi:REP element-mobilizing transposase RayT